MRYSLIAVFRPLRLAPLAACVLTPPRRRRPRVCDKKKQAIHEYAAELKENAELAAAGVAKGDFSPAWAFLKHHKGLVATVVLPTLLVFRFPGPVMVAMRCACLSFLNHPSFSSCLCLLWGHHQRL